MGLLELAERLQTALASFDKYDDIGIMWENDDRKAGVVTGPNALAGFPFATGQAESLDRFEAIVLAAEMCAEKSNARHAENAAPVRNDDDEV